MTDQLKEKEMTKLKDVIHLYLGCEMSADKAFYKGFTAPLIAHLQTSSFKDGIPLGSLETLDAKPILRPLSDMTEAEELKLLEYSGDLTHGWRKDIKINALRTQWLLKQSFDLFGLIESGQAIDKTTLNK